MPSEYATIDPAPLPRPGPTMTLEKALTLSPLLKTMYDEQPEVHRLIDTAMTLEGMPRHASTHAAGA